MKKLLVISLVLMVCVCSIPCVVLADDASSADNIKNNAHGGIVKVITTVADRISDDMQAFYNDKYYYSKAQDAYELALFINNIIKQYCNRMNTKLRDLEIISPKDNLEYLKYSCYSLGNTCFNNPYDLADVIINQFKDSKCIGVKIDPTTEDFKRNAENQLIKLENDMDKAISELIH